MISKDDCLNHCFEFVDQRLKMIDAALNDADEALSNDTKSSAGDKYETSREMIQQDINRYQKQLVLAENDKASLQKINSTVSSDRIGLGSIVKTNKGLYFVAISIGMVKINQLSVFIISPASPIGQLLLGKKVGDSIQFNNNEQKIIEIS